MGRKGEKGGREGKKERRGRGEGGRGEKRKGKKEKGGGEKGGRREGHGWPRAWRVEEGITAAGREQGEIRQTEVKKRDINI